MESLVTWFTAHLGPYISPKAVVFIISLMPILELRGGLLAASLLKIPEIEAIPISIIAHLGPYISPKAVVFIISLMPILELRGGLLAASLLKIPEIEAIPISIIGNILPIPFILLFIKQIFKWMKKVKLFRGLIEKLEKRAMSKSDQIQKYEFVGLMLFVGIPLPGTGAWTGALIASLLGIDIKKSSVAILCGIVIATVIMYFISYVLLGNIVS